MSGPIVVPSTVGGPGVMLPKSSPMAVTVSSYLDLGIRMRVESAQPCPQTSAVPNAAVMAGPLTSSRSSSRIIADLPPSSRNTLVTCSAAAHDGFPVAVEPVKEIMSTRGSSVKSAPMVGSAAEITLKTPGGMSVCSVTSRPSASASMGSVVPASTRPCIRRRAPVRSWRG